jgi:dihydroorotate dehydrogenase (NAD+) catalytic subunit
MFRNDQRLTLWIVTLTTDIAGLKLDNPVILAAGTAGTLDEMSDVVDISRIGAIVTKSITVEPREGNATWRIVPTDHGMINAIGLANVGLDIFMRDYAPRVKSVPTKVIGSISEFSVDGFVSVARAMNDAGFEAVELNVSCPNVHHGCEFGSDPAMLSELVREVRAVTTTSRLFVKLSPVVMGVPGIVAVAKAAIEPQGSTPRGPNNKPGADALCIANTVPAMSVDVETRKTRIARGSGGMSGPAVHPIAVKLVHDAYTGICRDTKTPIIGIGGVSSWRDAAEFILVGATAIEMGTALFVDPRSPLRVIDGLATWVKRQGCTHYSQLIGTVKEGVTDVRPL